MEHIQLSIIIPVCNVEKYIGPCLESIYRQGLAEEIFEVIIINDGSTDNSLNVISNLMNTHHNISIITNKENAGPSVSRNAGMEKAVGKYVLFVDSDDLLMDNGLSVLLQKAVNTSADMIVADYVRMKDEEIGSNYVSTVNCKPSTVNCKPSTVNCKPLTINTSTTSYPQAMQCSISRCPSTTKSLSSRRSEDFCCKATTCLIRAF